MEKRGRELEPINAIVLFSRRSVKKSSKAEFSTAYLKTKVFCHLWLYFTSIIKHHTKFICHKGVKIK